MTTNNTMSIYAEALIDNRQYANQRVNGEAVGVVKARLWAGAVKAVRMPAYKVAEYRYNNMGNTETVSPCDQTPLYNAIRPVLEMVGEVNGAKLNAKNVAEMIIANVTKMKKIDTSVAMSSARCDLKEARKAFNEDETEENEKRLEECKEEVRRLEDEPGNCKNILEIVSEGPFVKAVEMLLGDAILKQSLKSAEDIEAEELARKEARKAAAKARRQAKRQAEAKAKAEAENK